MTEYGAWWPTWSGARGEKRCDLRGRVETQLRDLYVRTAPARRASSPGCPAAEGASKANGNQRMEGSSVLACLGFVPCFFDSWLFAVVFVHSPSRAALAVLWWAVPRMSGGGGGGKQSKKK